jgi:hypothetical protein
LLRTIAEAVDYAHRLGVLHLDLKPANVLLDETGTPHVADFGLARRLDQGLDADNNEVSGTPSYMAPEQATAGAQKITPATDIWGLGAVLYELVTGEPPFLASTAHGTLRLVVEGVLRTPRRYTPNLPLDLQAIILKCMARDCAQRYPSGRALAEDLTRFIEGRAVKARPLNGLQRTARWARRDPKLATTALLALLALLGSLAATTQEWRRAESNREHAEARNTSPRRVPPRRTVCSGRAGGDALRLQTKALAAAAARGERDRAGKRRRAERDRAARDRHDPDAGRDADRPHDPSRCAADADGPGWLEGRLPRGRTRAPPVTRRASATGERARRPTRRHARPG